MRDSSNSLFAIAAIGLAVGVAVWAFRHHKTAVPTSHSGTPIFGDRLTQTFSIGGYTLPAGTTMTVVSVPSGTISPETPIEVKVGLVPVQDLPVGASFPEPGTVLTVPAKVLMRA